MPGLSQARFKRANPFVTRFKRVPGEGPVPARLMLIGDRPGKHEARMGRPFVGDAGQLLDTMLTAADLDRKQIYVTNMMKEYSETMPTAQERKDAGWELLSEIVDVNPDIIGCMGTFTVEFVLSRERAELERTHGVPVMWGDRVVIPMFNPAAALYNPETMPVVLDDMLRVAQVMAGELQVREDTYTSPDYRVLTSVHDLPSPCKLVAIDTEGTKAKPWSLQVSWQDGQGMLVDAKDGSAVHIFRSWLERERPRVVVHNYLYDAGMLRAMGVDLDDGYDFTDSMVKAYQLCVEPQSLKSLAYRHHAMEMHEYQELVAEPNRNLAVDFLLKVCETEWPAPEPYIVLEKGLPKVKKPQGINKLINRALGDLAADKRDKDGNPVDLRDRWGKWDDTVKGPVVEVLGEMPVATLEDVEPERARTYAIRDADATFRVNPILDARIRDMELDEAVAIDHAILPMVDRMQEVGIELAPVEFWDHIDDMCEAQMGRSKYEVYKLTGAEINPASGDQVADLLYGQLGLTPPKLTDSGARGSVNALALESLLSEAPVVQPIMDYNEANKIKGTYCRPLRKLCQIGDRRVRSTCRVTRTTTGRMSMADPPLHQIPIMTDLGREIRDGFVAPVGYVIGDWDLSQIEMRICAHESQDQRLCQFFWDDRDIHAETACLIFSVSMGNLSTDEHGKVNDVRRTVAKHAGFGIINGITEHGLHNYLILNRCRRPDGEAWTLDDCVMLLDGWFDIYKGVKKFHRDKIEETRATGLAREGIGGRIVYLPQVWSPIKWVRETAERMSYVMYTQGGAASLIKRCMAVMWRELFRDRRTFDTEPLAWVHDEIMAQVPEDECVRTVVDEMMQQILSTTVKLRVPVKASGGFGQSWLQAH